MFTFYMHLGASFIKFIALESNIYINVFLLYFVIWKQILNHYNFFSNESRWFIDFESMNLKPTSLLDPNENKGKKK